MTQREKWPRFAIVGAGAVGGYFGGLLARAGASVVMIGRKSFVEAVKTSGILLDTLTFKEFAPVEASTELGAARGADIVFFCVKTTDNSVTARNCALNAISALGRAKYGRIADNANARKLMETVIREVLAVARAAHVVLPGLDNAERAMTGAMKIATQMAEAMSSTAQDLNRGKLTEIDSLNGFIARRGSELGVPTPANHALFTLVKLAEYG